VVGRSPSIIAAKPGCDGRAVRDLESGFEQSRAEVDGFAANESNVETVTQGESRREVQ
jgi:hypothetical protein